LSGHLAGDFVQKRRDQLWMIVERLHQKQGPCGLGAVAPVLDHCLEHGLHRLPKLPRGILEWLTEGVRLFRVVDHDEWRRDRLLDEIEQGAQRRAII
jgi:hypothetical protein